MNPRTAEPLFYAAYWCRLRELAERLDALDAQARERELQQLAVTEPRQAEQVRALLAQDAHADVEALSAAVQRTLLQASVQPGRIGPFVVLRRLGAGGMGVVYLGERDTPEFVQRVALKLLDGDAARGAHLAARERRVLASLSHPNITAFVDAGTQDGQAWLAMEYVDGEPLLAYCERQNLGVRERVLLFEQVCLAVAYAHSQLVVHRDLKPSNVLVAGGGTVKLLDFGIARVLDASDEQAPATRVFTPEYAAPEQLRGERATTATDVYALGLMLYELIAGRRLPTLDRGGADADWTAATLARHATAAHASAKAPGNDARALRGDLGRILAHALATDATQRYGTVAQLRADLKRWLEFRPLTIARPALRYVASRFVRRNRVAVTIVAVATIALLATTAFALLQAQQATLMAARAEHARTFLAGLFSNANPYNPKRNGTSTIDLMREAARRIDHEFADAPSMRIELRAPIIDALTQLDEAQAAHDLALANAIDARGVYGENAPQTGVALYQLALATEAAGDVDKARDEFTEAYALLRDAGNGYAHDRIAAMTGLAKMANRRDDYAQAQRWHEAVLHEREAREGPRSADMVMDLMNLSSDAAYQEHFAQSEALAQRAHGMLAQVLSPDHPRSIYVDNELGAAQADMGHCADAVKTLTAAVTVARKNLPPGARMLHIVLTNLGRAQSCAGDNAAAMATLHEALASASAALDPNRAGIELRLGLVELHAHVDAALSTLNAARTDLAAHAEIAAQAPRILWAQAAYGDALAIHGNVADGVRQAREARLAMKAGKYRDSVMLGEIDLLLADTLDRQTESAQARSIREEALAIFLRVYGDGHPETRTLAAKLGST